MKSVKKIKEIKKRVLNKMRFLWAQTSSKRLVDYYRERGIRIGANCRILHPKSCTIDISRPSLVTIGDNCFINHNFTLLTHDFVANVFSRSGGYFLPSSGAVWIGNNVSFAWNVTVLKGVKIGDNCFIGIGSVVTKDIPANSVAVGAPARVVCTIEEYFERRKTECVSEAFEYANSIIDSGRQPTLEDFREERYLFTSGLPSQIFENMQKFVEAAQQAKG